MLIGGTFRRELRNFDGVYGQYIVRTKRLKGGRVQSRRRVTATKVELERSRIGSVAVELDIPGEIA